MWHFLTLLAISLFSVEAAMHLPPVIEAPYGSWTSPITAGSVVAEAVRLGGAKEIGGAIYFSESRPLEQGRTVLIRWTPENGFDDLLPAPYNARTRVHEYGGGSVLFNRGKIYFSNFSDQQLYCIDEKGAISQWTRGEKSRFADGCAYGDLFFYVMETHGETVENCLVAINQEGEVRRIAEGSDFYAAPRVSPDGTRLAYYCWDHPNMPWDGGELRIAELKEDGSLGETKVVAGGKEESICQHAWGSDGRIYYLSDRSGWWNLYCEEKPLFPMEAEIGFPQWVFGRSFFDFWGRDLVFVYSKQGTDFLAILRDEIFVPIDLPFTSIKNPSVTGDRLYFVGSSPQFPPALIQLNLKTKEWVVLKKSQEAQISPDYLSMPQAIEFPTSGGLTAHAFYYPPKNSRYRGPEGEFPPLLVLSHGGPTAHETPRYNLEIQYWTSRGIAVVDVNYGGSSGYGREYRDRLRGSWGVVDVDDCTNAALYCAEQGLADRHRLCIAGGSAGGYTTLACLAFRKVFCAGASFFGVSDLEALVLDTHKFESRYLDRLIGPYPEARDLYIERSPLYHVDQIECPVILLQGDEDKIVPPPQSEKMYRSLLERNIPTAYLLFEKEQHGFRQAKNIRRAIEAEAYFFAKICGFAIADPIEPVEIANFHE